MDENMKIGLVVGIPAGLAAILVAASLGGRAQPPVGCMNGEQQTQGCPDGSTIVAMQCQNGQWVYTGAQCPPDLINVGTHNYIEMYQDPRGISFLRYDIFNQATGMIQEGLSIDQQGWADLTLGQLRGWGTINQIQYDNGMAQAFNLGATA
ncbi:hypothetical protein ES703_65915 [subsurface metagenome]